MVRLSLPTFSLSSRPYSHPPLPYTETHLTFTVQIYKPNKHDFIASLKDHQVSNSLREQQVQYGNFEQQNLETIHSSLHQVTSTNHQMLNDTNDENHIHSDKNAFHPIPTHENNANNWMNGSYNPMR